MGKYITILVVSLIAILIGIFAFLQQPLGDQQLDKVITLAVIAFAIFSWIIYWVFIKIINPPVSTFFIPLIIIVAGIPLIGLGFFNQHGRFYNNQQSLTQSSQIEKLDHQAAQHHAGFLFLFPSDEIDPHALNKLKHLKPINKERSKQKDKALKRINKVKHNIEESNKHKYNSFDF